MHFVSVLPSVLYTTFVVGGEEFTLLLYCIRRAELQIAVGGSAMVAHELLCAGGVRCNAVGL